MDASVETTCSLRFLALRPDLVAVVRKHRPEASDRPSRRVPDARTVTFDITDDRDLSWLPALVRDHGVASDSIDLFVSTVTEHDSWIVSIPDYVLSISRELSCGIEVSFTVV
ncbi:MAG: hypothetical protein AAGD38_05015 [Acidobacteriota bacterium]